MNTCFQIQRASDHAVFAPKWGETGFKKTGKSYATRGHAKAAWKIHASNWHHPDDVPDVEIVEYKTIEVGREKL